MERFSYRARLAPALAAVALMLVMTAGGAGAWGISWCQSDPVLKINGQVVDVRVSSVTEMKSLATGPIQLVVTVPTGTSTELLAADQGFGYGYRVSFVQSDRLLKKAVGAEVQLAVYAPASDGSLPVKVGFRPLSANGEFTLAASAIGTANTWVSLTAT
jgi:hypothetical protein